MLGDGSDTQPFCVSMHSNVLSKEQNWVLPVVLHMECTFKLNDNKFPLVMIGLTDAAQKLHVLRVSIVSHSTYAMY